MNSTLDQYLQYYGQFMNATELAQLEQNKLDLNETIATAMKNETELLLHLYTNDAERSAPVIQGILNSILEAFNKNLIGAEEIIGLGSRSLTDRSLKETDYFIPGYIAVFIMTNGIIGVTATVSEYRRNGIVKRLVATPIGKGAWILANLLHQTFLAFCLMAIMIYQNPQASLIPFLVMGMMAIICILLAIKVTKWKELD